MVVFLLIFFFGDGERNDPMKYTVPLHSLSIILLDMRLGIQGNSCYITKEPSGKASFVHSSTQVEKYGSISIQ